MADTPEGFKDMLGIPLHTGDYVIVSHPEYRRLQAGKIVGWTAKKVRVSYIIENDLFSKGKLGVIAPESNNFVKVDEQSVMFGKLQNKE